MLKNFLPFCSNMILHRSDICFINYVLQIQYLFKLHSMLVYFWFVDSLNKKLICLCILNGIFMYKVSKVNCIQLDQAL